MRFRQSELKDFLVCQRSWYLNYWLNPNERGQSEVPAYPGPAEIGSMVHAAIHADVEGLTPRQGADQWIDRSGVDMSDPGLVAIWADEATKAAFYAERYLEWLSVEGLDVGTTLLGHEMELEVEIGATGHRVYGSLDRLDAGPHGIGVQDYKTGKQFRDLLPNDFQMLTYAYMVRESGLGSPTRGCYARIKTVQTTRTGEPQDHVYMVINDEMLDQHERHLISIAYDLERVVELLDQGMDPVEIRPTTSNDCSWRCDALAACGAMSGGDYWEDVLPYPKGPSPGFNQRGSTS